jgi:hypothetical protein
MLRHPLRATLVCALACTIAACSTLYVKSDVNTALIGQVRCNSFAWAGSFRGNSPLRGGIANPVNESRLRSAIAAHLKGPIQDGQGNADCLLGYGIGATRAVDWPYGYPEGIIAVDMYDARSHKPLWHASVDQNLVGVSGAEAQKRIDAAVAAIFTKYPG